MESQNGILTPHEPSRQLEFTLASNRSTLGTSSTDQEGGAEHRTCRTGHDFEPGTHQDRAAISAACARCGKAMRIPSQAAARRPVLCEECYLAYQRGGGAI